MSILTSLFNNKVAVFNIILVSTILIFLLIANVQQEVNIEEYATIPFDNTPTLLEEHKYNGEVELAYDKDTFNIEYRIGKFPLESTAIADVVITDCNESSKPLPLSPATSIFYLEREGSLSLALAIKKITEDPAVYSIKIEDNKIICYFSDPFPTGYDSIIIYTIIEDKDKVRIEISKVKTLG